MMKVVALVLLMVMSSCTKKYRDPKAPLPESMEASVQSSFRSPENEERDEYQHPQETLEFFGLLPNQTVVEVNPGNGYLTEILAPYLARQGQLVLAVPRMPPHPPRVLIENEKKLQDILLRQNDVQTITKLIPFEPVDKRNRIQKDFADMVLVLNSVHNLVAQNSVTPSFQFFYDILKPGGTLGIVQHRVRDGYQQVPKSGYLYEREVIQMAQAAGFKFVGKSEINANPKDFANYPEGVWVLPPTYRLGDQDREKYEDIGESDRMTLKFQK